MYRSAAMGAESKNIGGSGKFFLDRASGAEPAKCCRPFFKILIECTEPVLTFPAFTVSNSKKTAILLFFDQAV
jgi:hypothetical protein